ncbi:hypothetical protein K492DRAFT_183453 [Lichtheimia hyalospora FSU 10163]|nr:hypothetical protein K492DRAFT_183453 [Lichtheimia hyalospora FSU 10163]
MPIEFFHAIIPLTKYQAVHESRMSADQSFSAGKIDHNHYTSDSSSDKDSDDAQECQRNTLFRTWSDDNDDDDDDQRMSPSRVSTVMDVASNNGTINMNTSQVEYIILNINTNRGTLIVDANDSSIVIVNIVNNYGLVRVASTDASIVRLNINNTNNGIVICTSD